MDLSLALLQESFVHSLNVIVFQFFLLRMKVNSLLQLLSWCCSQLRKAKHPFTFSLLMFYCKTRGSSIYKATFLKVTVTTLILNSKQYPTNSRLLQVFQESSQSMSNTNYLAWLCVNVVLNCQPENRIQISHTSLRSPYKIEWGNSSHLAIPA